MRSISRLANAALAVALMVGCSSNNSSNNNDGSMGTGGTYGPTTRLVDLSRPELSQLCMQESVNAAGVVSCGADGSVSVVPIGVCTSLTPDCSATVATSQTCASKMNADACNPKQMNADIKSPECLVMLECTGSLCGNTMCFCPDYNSLSTCTTTCKRFTSGLTTACASCIAGLYNALMCPDFTMLQSPYDQCTAICAQSDAGTKG